jgi:hypothetical protein
MITISIEQIALIGYSGNFGHVYFPVVGHRTMVSLNGGTARQFAGAGRLVISDSSGKEVQSAQRVGRPANGFLPQMTKILGATHVRLKSPDEALGHGDAQAVLTLQSGSFYDLPAQSRVNGDELYLDAEWMFRDGLQTQRLTNVVQFRVDTALNHTYRFVAPGSHPPLDIALPDGAQLTITNEDVGHRSEIVVINRRVLLPEFKQLYRLLSPTPPAHRQFEPSTNERTAATPGLTPKQIKELELENPKFPICPVGEGDPDPEP